MAIHKIVYSVKRGVCVDVKDVFYETQRKQIECGVQSFAGLCVDCCYLFLTAFCIVQSNMYRKNWTLTTCTIQSGISKSKITSSTWDQFCLFKFNNSGFTSSTLECLLVEVKIVPVLKSFSVTWLLHLLSQNKKNSQVKKTFDLKLRIGNKFKILVNVRLLVTITTLIWNWTRPLHCLQLNVTRGKYSGIL